MSLRETSVTSTTLLRSRLVLVALAVWTAAVALLAVWESRRTVTLCAFGSCGDPIAEPFRWSVFALGAVFVTLVVAGIVAIVAEAVRPEVQA